MGLKMALRAYGKHAIQKFVDDGTEFNHGSLKGKKFTSWYAVPKGRLDDHPDVANYNLHWSLKPVSVLYSYQTPIAWKFDGEKDWFIPEIYYSVTTTNHQNVARVATTNPGFYTGKGW